MVYEWAKNNNIALLSKLRTMLEIMQRLDYMLPVYDFSREEDSIVQVLDKERFLELSKSLKGNDLLSSLGIIK